MFQQKSKTGYLRWMILSMLLFATTINYLDRFILGILAPTLEKEIGWTEVQYSYIIMAFQIAYGLGNIIMGYVIDRLGTRIGYAITITIWSIASLSHVLARSWVHFAISRFGLGIGEAGNFPAAIKTVAEWFPKKERAFATGIFNSGSQIGIILASIIIPIIVIKFNWRYAFFVTFLFSLSWLILWLIFYERPEKHKKIKKEELDYILSDSHDIENNKKTSWISLLKLKQTWAIAFAKLFSDPVWWFYLFWGAKFLHEKFGVDLHEIALPLIAIYAVADIGGISFGWLSSYLIKKNWGINKARKITLMICAILVIPVSFLPYLDSMWFAISLLALAAAGHCGWAANVFTLASDIFPKKVVGSVVGIGATISTTGAAIASIGIGYALNESGLDGYKIPFLVASVGYIFALIILQILVPKLKPLTSIE